MFRSKNKTKGSGPVKAMTSIYATNEETSDKNGSPTKSKDKKKSKKQGSKDDSVMLESAGKIKWKANPYATIKMWRPITMTTSITSEEEVYQNFSSFQHLREMSNRKASNEQTVNSKNNQTISSFPSVSMPPSELLSLHIPEAPSPCKPSLQQSVSESSYDVISDTASDSVKAVLSKLYIQKDYKDAKADIDRFLTELRFTMESLQKSGTQKHCTQFEVCREELLNQTKQLINDAKLFVSSANNSNDKLTHYLNVAMHSLARVFLHSQSVMLMMTSEHAAQHFGLEITKVCHAFKSTISAAYAAVGKPLNDQLMKHLMRQATNLAGLMSILLREIRNLKSSEK